MDRQIFGRAPGASRKPASTARRARQKQKKNPPGRPAGICEADGPGRALKSAVGVDEAQGAARIFGGRFWRSLFLPGQAQDYFPRLFDPLQYFQYRVCYGKKGSS